MAANGSKLDYKTEPTLNMQVEISNAINNSTADVFVTVTNIADDAPTITVQPQSDEVREGESSSLSVTAKGNGTLSYEWLKNSVSMGKHDNSTLTLASGEIDENATYSCKVTNEFGEAISPSASVSVRAMPVVDLGKDIVISTVEMVIFDAGAVYSNYHWSDNSSEQALDFAGTGHGKGNYTVSVTVTDDLGRAGYYEVNVDVTVATTIKKTVTAEIDVYPNRQHQVL